MEIKILGTGCKKCQEVAAIVQNTVAELNLTDVQILKIEDATEIANHGVLITPALLINGKTKLAGRVPAKDAVEKWLIAEKQ
ncbi:MAG: thioredoxin family protein [Desulfotomaculum sp.]|nr:thioredoxin family protein [Desulfotomaculum sp.]